MLFCYILKLTFDNIKRLDYSVFGKFYKPTVNYLLLRNGMLQIKMEAKRLIKK